LEFFFYLVERLHHTDLMMNTSPETWVEIVPARNKIKLHVTYIYTHKCGRRNWFIYHERTKCRNRLFT